LGYKGDKSKLKLSGKGQSKLNLSGNGNECKPLTYGVVHEHWHVEDFVQTRHTLRYPAPALRPRAATHPACVADVWGGWGQPDIALPTTSSIAF